MLTLRSLKTLLWVKERRLKELEAQVQEKVLALQVRVDEHATADQQVTQCRQEEADCREKIISLGQAQALNPSHIVTLQYVLKDLVELTKKADTLLQYAIKKVNEAQQQLDEARKAVQRATTQRDNLEEERVKLLKLADQAMEDAQDEESEEAAVARGVTRRHAAARAQTEMAS